MSRRSRNLRRQHRRKDGRPKAALTEVEAERQASRYDPRLGYEAYKCPLCPAWHIGSRGERAA